MIHAILSAALVFAVLVVVHEAGHFAMAKKVGVRVLRFSVGYPPKIFGYRRGETDYAIGATPFGGYVRMLGDEVGGEPKPEELTMYLHEVGLDLIGAAVERGVIHSGSSFDDNMRVDFRAPAAIRTRPLPIPSSGAICKPDEALLINEVRRQPKVDDAIKALAEHPPAALVEAYSKRAFPTQTLGKRTLIVLAGPIANIIFAPILLTLVFMTGVKQMLPVVGKTTKDLPAAKAGLLTGDRILSVDGQADGDLGRFLEDGEGGRRLRGQAGNRAAAQRQAAAQHAGNHADAARSENHLRHQRDQLGDRSAAAGRRGDEALRPVRRGERSGGDFVRYDDPDGGRHCQYHLPAARRCATRWAGRS